MAFGAVSAVLLEDRVEFSGERDLEFRIQGGLFWEFRRLKAVFLLRRCSVIHAPVGGSDPRMGVPVPWKVQVLVIEEGHIDSLVSVSWQETVQGVDCTAWPGCLGANLFFLNLRSFLDSAFSSG